MATKKPRAALLNRTVDESDCCELAAHILGIAPDNDAHVEGELYNRFGCTMDDFTELIRALAPMALRARSPLTGTAYAGFAVIEKDGQAEMLVKVEVDPKDQRNYK